MAPLPSSLFSWLANVYYSPDILASIREQIAPAAGLKLLDVPCGTGILHSICLPCEYQGVDIDPVRVESARKTLGSGLAIRHGDASALDLPDSSVDRILAAGLFHHVNDEVAVRILDEFARVLKPGGHVVVFEAIWPRNRANLFGRIMRHMDEGKFVRQPEAYGALFKKRFSTRARSFPARLGLDYLLESLVPLQAKGADSGA